MEGFIARWYAPGTRRATCATTASCARGVAAQVPPRGSVLEAAGARAGLPAPWRPAGSSASSGSAGPTPRRTFVQIATDHARAARAAIDFRLGDAAAHAVRRERVRLRRLAARGVQELRRPGRRARRDPPRAPKPGGRASIFDPAQRTPRPRTIERELRGDEPVAAEPLAHALDLPPHADPARATATRRSPR